MTVDFTEILVPIPEHGSDEVKAFAAVEHIIENMLPLKGSDGRLRDQNWSGRERLAAWVMEKYGRFMK